MDGDLVLRLALGLGASVFIGYPSYKKRAVDLSGFLSGIVVGTLAFIGGWQLFAVLMLFFISSSILTKYRYEEKAMKEAAEKGTGRSVAQVIGAGGVAALFGLLKVLFEKGVFLNHNPWMVASVFAFLGAVSASNADTWAIELGALSPNDPVLITNPRKKVPPGTSGGVTLLGEIGSFLGALFIAAAATAIICLSPKPVLPFDQVSLNLALKIFVITLLSGFIAEKIDSLLGATIQIKYYCPTCKKITDKKVHKCGTVTQYYSGYKIITNEVVNILSTAFGALLAIALFFLL